MANGTTDTLWMFNAGDNTYATEASDLGPRGSTMFKAPCCSRVVHASELQGDRDGEGELQGWWLRCRCGARLVIFND